MKKFFLLLMVFFSCLSVHAQTMVHGTVRDSKGDPVPGAYVILDGSGSIGVNTSISGEYTIQIPSGVQKPVLRFSCLSFAELKEPVNGRSVVDVVLSDDSTQLEEVVVVGYGAMRKSDLTGAVTSVRINEDNASRSTSLDQLLQGHAAGVQVTSNSGAPDAGVSIRIRGLSSFNGSTEPLYVVDGIIINASQGGETMLSMGMDNSDSDELVNGLMGINPQDIESMEILKDASATAIYGALGANGVVLITTKSAKKDKPVVSFSGGVGISAVTKRMDVLSFNEFTSYLRDKALMGVGHNADQGLSRIFSDPEGMSGLKVTPADWQDVCLRTAVSTRYHLQITGKPRRLSYSFSLGYSDNQGVVRNTGVSQISARLNLEKYVNKRLRFGTKTGISYIDSDMTQGTGGGRMTAATSLVRSMISYRPYYNSVPDAEDYEDDDVEIKSSPDKWINKNHFLNTRKELRVTPSLFVEYKMLPWLTFKSTFGGDYRNSDKNKFKSMMLNSTSYGSSGASLTSQALSWNWDNLLLYKVGKGSNTFSGTLGMSAHKSSSSVMKVQGWNIDQFLGHMASLNTAPNASISYGEDSNQTLSFFARGIYNYKDRYVATATFRADGSSRFAEGNKWAFFPSLAFAWRISEENWFNVRQISSAKLRLGWGQVGNQSIGNYQTTSNYYAGVVASQNPGNAAGTTVTLYPVNISNPLLQWETTRQLNAGLDVGLFKGRLSFSADFYDKLTFNLLQNKLIPTSSGFSSIAYNEGRIRNRGFELSLDTVPLKTRGFEIALSGNFSLNRNRIMQISESAARKDVWVSTEECREVTYFDGTQIGSSSYCIQTANIFMEGYEMGLFYGYKMRGIIPENGTGTPLTEGGTPGIAGQLDYYDLNGNGYIDENDRTIIGNPNPDFTYGFSISATLRRFSLNLDFTGVYGVDIFNFNAACESDTYTSTRNVFREAYYDAWTPSNQNAKYPALGMIRSGDYEKFSDFYLEDGSYLRLANVSLSYSIPMKDGRILKNIGVGASARNAFVLTRYSGWDPDVNSYGTNIRKMGIDSGSYPSCRSFNFDLKFTF